MCPATSGGTGARPSSANTPICASWARCSTATRPSSPSSRAAPQGRHRHRHRRRCSTSRSTIAVRRAFAEGRSMRELVHGPGPRSSLQRPSLPRHLPGTARRPALHERARAPPLAGSARPLHSSRQPAGSPSLYYGDEIGMPGGGDPDNRRDFPGGLPGTRGTPSLPADRRRGAAVFESLRRLAWLRAELAPLRRGRMVTLAVTEQAWAYARVLGDQAVVVVLNNAAEPVSLDIPTAAAGWTAERSRRGPARWRRRACRRRTPARFARPAGGGDLHGPLVSGNPGPAPFVLQRTRKGRSGAWNSPLSCGSCCRCCRRRRPPRRARRRGSSRAMGPTWV